MAPGAETLGRTRSSEAVVIAGVPAFVSLLTYSYEYGFASTFAVPWRLVSVTWAMAFTVCAYLVVVLFFWWLGVQTILLLSRSSLVAYSSIWWGSTLFFFLVEFYLRKQTDFLIFAAGTALSAVLYYPMACHFLS